jgi:hypothetical protein
MGPSGVALKGATGAVAAGVCGGGDCAVMVMTRVQWEMPDIVKASCGHAALKQCMGEWPWLLTTPPKPVHVCCCCYCACVCVCVQMLHILLHSSCSSAPPPCAPPSPHRVRVESARASAPASQPNRLAAAARAAGEAGPGARGHPPAAAAAAAASAVPLHRSVPPAAPLLLASS